MSSDNRGVPQVFYPHWLDPGSVCLVRQSLAAQTTLSNGPSHRRSDLHYGSSRKPDPEVYSHLKLLFAGEFGYMPERTIRDIAWRLYHFTETDRWFKTAFPVKSSDRTRNRRNPPSPPFSVPFGVTSCDGFTFKSQIPRPIQFEKYRCQEQMLHSIDCYVHYVFDSISGRWSPGLAEFWLPPEEQAALFRMSGQLATWQRLADQSYGVSVLLNAGLDREACKSLDLLLAGVKAAAQHQDPSFMVKFWRLCLQMCTIDKHSSLQAFQKLCSELKTVYNDKFRVRNAVTTMVQALQQVQTEDIRHTLRIGFDKTLRTMTGLIGDENAMLLHMWSHYFKYWDEQYLCADALLLKFDYIWHMSKSLFPSDPEVDIAITYYYAYAAYYVGNKEWHELGEKMIATVHSLSSERLAAEVSPEWTLTTLAFAFSSRIEALARWKEGDINASMCIMLSAITTLERGDRECRIRAMMLAGVLTRWMKKWGLIDESGLIKQRGEMIQNSISD